MMDFRHPKSLEIKGKLFIASKKDLVRAARDANGLDRLHADRCDSLGTGCLSRKQDAK